MVSGCAQRTLESYRPKNPDEELVIATLQKIKNGINTKSLDVLMQPYADDVYIGNFHKYIGVARHIGYRTTTKADLRTAYGQLFEYAKDVSLDFKDFQLTVVGDRAVAEARTELLLKLQAGRREAREDLLRNDVTWRLRRTPAGWKIMEEVFQ
jgi:ketosteroid isomerase-like protein